ncbi:MAG: toprim domain-containing protein [Sarcina sp.]
MDLTHKDSAAGSILLVRDVLTQAYLALKGKVVNVEKTTRPQALGNQEIRSMIQAFGCGVGESFDLSKLKYDKIIILTDADVK